MRLGVLVLLCSTPAFAGSAHGRYIPSQSSATVKAELDRAVEDGVQQVSWALRGLARPQLAKTTHACPAYTFDIEGSDFTVQCQGRDAFSWTVGRTGTWTDEKGDAIKVSLKATGERSWLIDFEADAGGKRIHYQFDEAAGLTVTQEVYSSHLSEPVRWTLLYRKP